MFFWSFNLQSQIFSFLPYSYSTLCLASWTYWGWNFYDSRNGHMKFFIQHQLCACKTLASTINSWLQHFHTVIICQNLGKSIRVCFQISFKLKLKTILKASSSFHVECKTKSWWNEPKHTPVIDYEYQT